MFTPRPSRPSPPNPYTTAPRVPKPRSTPQPFRFLGLPKEIRLMIYEELRPQTTRTEIPLRPSTSGHHITLVNTVVPGISILVTNQQIHSEATQVLTPILHRIIACPPTLSVAAEHIISLINLHDSFDLLRNSVLNEALLYVFSEQACVEAIHDWRAGALPTARLRRTLRLQHVLAPSSSSEDVSLSAIARFTLRIVRYKSSRPATMYAHPPLTLSITLPQTFISLHVTTTTSRLKALSYRFLDRSAVARPRMQTGLADLNWVLCRFAFGTAFVCRLWGGVAVSVRVRGFVGDAREVLVMRAVMRGVWDAGCQGEGVLYYGGVAVAVEDEV